MAIVPLIRWQEEWWKIAHDARNCQRFLEATLSLQIYGPVNHATKTAVLDTGYNGALTLPLSVITALALTKRAPRPVTLGDATQQVLNFYEAEVDWDGQRRITPVLCVEGDHLIGTALLNGYKMEADFVVGGQVRIS